MTLTAKLFTSGPFQPTPTGDLGWVLTVHSPIATSVQSSVNHLLAQCRRGGFEAGDPIEHVNDEMEPVEVVEHHHVEGCRRGSLLLVPAYVEVVVIPPSVSQAMNQRRVPVV